MDTADRLGEIEARQGRPTRDEAETALRFEWFDFNENYPEYGHTDLVQAYRAGHEDARADVPVLVAALRAVLNLHKPRDWHGKKICDACSETEDALFMECPCPTVRTIADELGAEL